MAQVFRNHPLLGCVFNTGTTCILKFDHSAFFIKDKMHFRMSEYNLTFYAVILLN